MVRTSTGRRVSTGSDAKAKKADERCEKCFSKALEQAEEQSLKSQADYCHKMIDDNPRVVPYLASIFKKCLIAKMMAKAQAGDDDRTEELGRIVAGKSKKMCMLPVSDSLTDDHINHAFQYMLHISEHTPLPEDPNAKYSKVLTSFCNLRWESVGKRCAADKFKEELGRAEPFSFYSIILYEDQPTLVYHPNNTKAWIPINTGSYDDWNLGSVFDVDTEMTNEKAKGCTLTPKFFFEEVMGDKFGIHDVWTMTWSSEAVLVGSPSSSGDNGQAADIFMTTPATKKARTTLRLSPGTE